MNTIYTDMTACEELASVGKILKETRQKHAVHDLNMIADELCIKPYLLEALEQGDFDSFPSACYATGFLKNYAGFLALDTKDIIEKYEAEYAGSKECVVLSFPEAEYQNKFPLKRMAGVASLCVAIFAGLWATNNNLDAEEATSGFQQTNTQSSAVVDEKPTISIAMKAASEVAPMVEKETIVIEAPLMGDDIRFQAKDDVWVRISAEDGSTVIEKLMTKGENLIPPSEGGLSLMTNNAGAISVSVGDEKAKTLGYEGQILENVALKQDKLLEFSMLDK